MANEDGGGLGLKLRYFNVWLSARSLPKNWVRGNFSKIKLLRFSMVIISLISFSSVALGSTVWNSASFAGLWYGAISAGYVLTAMIFLLGMRMWYGAGEAFFIVSGIINLGINDAGTGFNPLGAAANAYVNSFIAIFWVYLVIVGLLMMRYDKGSKLNDLLQQS